MVYVTLESLFETMHYDLCVYVLGKFQAVHSRDRIILPYINYISRSPREHFIKSTPAFDGSIYLRKKQQENVPCTRCSRQHTGVCGIVRLQTACCLWRMTSVSPSPPGEVTSSKRSYSFLSSQISPFAPHTLRRYNNSHT